MAQLHRNFRRFKNGTGVFIRHLKVQKVASVHSEIFFYVGEVLLYLLKVLV